MDLAHLLTEQHRPELADLDLRDTLSLVKLMADDQKHAIEAIAAVEAAITTAIDAVVERLTAGGRLIYVGAGTAGRLGLLDAAECPPTFNTDRVTGVIAGGFDAFLSPREAIEDDAAAGAGDLEDADVGEVDAVVAVTASGRTPYTVGAIRHARGQGALTIGIVCNPDSVLSRHVDHSIEVLVGPEIIAGSTRLKAGTAQKIVLNTISTVSMVRLGKTFGNLMVDLRATNAKLKDRARRIVAQATGAGAEEVELALDAAEGEVKVAIIMLLTKGDPETARRQLAAGDGVERKALEAG
ncbi:MAG: N-acetylmuramic acid 6-phosphate etherase [Acidimicrobiia bacterium]